MKYTKDILQSAIIKSATWADVCRVFNIKPSTGGQSHLKSRALAFNLDFSHFNTDPHNKGKVATNKKHWSEILILRPDGSTRQKTFQLVRALKEYGRRYCCELCDNHGIWRNKPLALEVDHKNGNWVDDRPENLRFLCSNCHTQETKENTESIKKIYFCILCETNTVSRGGVRCKSCYHSSRKS